MVAALLGLSGCGHFIRLKRDVRKLEVDSFLGGHVSTAATAEHPGRVIVAIITRNPDTRPSLLDIAILPPQETIFAFSVPPADHVQLAAFRDENDDGIFQKNEPAWLSEEFSSEDRDANRRFPIQEVTLQSPAAIPEDLLSALREARAGRPLTELTEGNQLRVSLGHVEGFDSPRFSQAAANLGFWEPLEFLNQHGTGIYFLEPYDPRRTPVLLVHGASGSPGDWRSLVPLLDRSKHQIWLFGYPSGLRLGDSSDILRTATARLQERYGFQRLDVIAHSMGGLVARGFLLKAQSNGPKLPGVFISLSTPWSGHSSAGFGVKYAPVAIPSWRDLQPDSEFQKKLFEQPLPDDRPHYLAFSYRGSASVVLPESNDGIVSIESELATNAQREARSIRGFNETHTGILSSETTAAWINEILSASAPSRQAPTR